MKIEIIIFVIFLSLITRSVNAQEYSYEYGTVTDDEILMNEYENDPDAEAVIIYCIGESSFIYEEGSFKLKFEERIKIKILKESFLEKTEFSLPLFKGRGIKKNNTKVEGATYNFANGEVVKTKLNKENLFTEKISDDFYHIKYTMPRIKAGSVIELKFSIITNGIYELQDWYFQYSIPTIYSECAVNMIPFYTYKLVLRGAPDFDHKIVSEEEDYRENFNIEYREKKYQFIMKNVPAFTDESFITSAEDYRMKLDFQLDKIYPLEGTRPLEILSSWEQMNENLTEHPYFGLYINKSKNKFKKILDEEDILNSSPNEKVKFIMDYIKNNYRWNKYHGIFAQKSFNDFQKDKTGNTGNINLTLIGALRSVGILVYPIILSTRNNGKIIKEFPFSDPFNYVTAYAKIGDKWKLLDATDRFCPIDMIPIKCMNDVGLIVNKHSVEWYTFNQKDMSVRQTDIKTEFNQDNNTLKSDFTINTTKYIALDYRKSFSNNFDEIISNFSEYNQEYVDSVKTLNYNEPDKNYKIFFKSRHSTDRIGNKIFIHPFQKFSIQDNPFKQEERKYPVDLIYPETNILKNEIKLPEGYEVSQLPENFSYNDKNFLLQLSTSQTGNLVKVSAMYQLKKAVYQPEEYNEIKQFYDLLIDHLNQKIVLTDIKGD